MWCRWIALSLVLSSASCNKNLPTCDPGDFHYELTECDATGGRWRVSVPTPGTCTGGTPNAPQRLHGCLLTCSPGEYYEIESLSCRRCPPGLYSLGPMVRYDSWDSFPPDFKSAVEPFTSKSSFSFVERERSNFNCSRSSWQPRGDFIAFLGGPCVASLLYTVRLVQPGILNFTYQYPDDDVIFEFQSQDELCQNVASSDEFKWPSVTEEGKWQTKTIHLNEGVNILQWRAMGIGSRQTKPLLIKTIEVTGVAPASKCTPCRNGTYASSSGSSECVDCPADTFSSRGSSSCSGCDKKLYFAPAGSSQCLKRPPCKESDYYEVHSACDERNTTVVSYKWVEPRVCRDDLPGSVSLPLSSGTKKCPPCNPGMQMDYSLGSCQFCPAGMISDGVKACSPCPPTTAPNTGFQFVWWNSLPSIITSRCMSIEGPGCSKAAGWLAAGDHIKSGQGHSSNSYLILSLRVDQGFKGRGNVLFTFQLDCQADCQFVFMQSSPKKGVTVIRTWSGTQPRQHYSHTVTQNASYTFSWAFQKQAWNDEGSLQGFTRLGSRIVDTDVARIFSINVTNTVEGGATDCLPCAQGSDASGCIPCPDGHYITEEENRAGQCAKCPPDTIVPDPFTVGSSACVPCGSGLTTKDHKQCSSDCRPVLNDTRYDLRKIGEKATEVKGSLLFTASGMQYFHVFNISLCAKQPVVCANNISFQADGEPNQVQALVCRSTMIPAQSNAADGTPLSTQSVSLGDHLLGMTKQTTLNNISVLEEFIDQNHNDLHVFFYTTSVTRSCPMGRTTTVTLRCDPDQSGQGQVLLPSRCPDGTCDGCNFHFLWMSSAVCPICGPRDLHVIKGECIDDEQTIHHLGSRNCIMMEDALQPKKVPCSTRVSTLVMLIIGGCVSLAILLTIILFMCWKQNQRLAYKYMQLKQDASHSTSKSQLTDVDGDDELGAAESCALHDGEEEDEEVSITVPIRGYGLINKLRTITSSKGETGGPFEVIQLTEKEAQA